MAARPLSCPSVIWRQMNDEGRGLATGPPSLQSFPCLFMDLVPGRTYYHGPGMGCLKTHQPVLGNRIFSLVECSSLQDSDFLFFLTCFLLLQIGDHSDKRVIYQKPKTLLSLYRFLAIIVVAFISHTFGSINILRCLRSGQEEDLQSVSRRLPIFLFSE